MGLAQDCRGGTNGKHPLVVIIEGAYRILDCRARLEVLDADSATRQEYTIKIGGFQFIQSNIGLDFNSMKTINEIGARKRGYGHLKTSATP